MERRPDTTPYRGPHLLAMERLPVSLLAEADIFLQKIFARSAGDAEAAGTPLVWHGGTQGARVAPGRTLTPAGAAGLDGYQGEQVLCLPCSLYTIVSHPGVPFAEGD